MIRFKQLTLMAMLMAGATGVAAASDVPWSIVAQTPIQGESAAIRALGAQAHPGLPGQRPRLAMTLPRFGLADAASSASGNKERGESSAFSWSLETWQMNTASLAHIQCSQGMLTMDTYVAQNCRFVDQPLPGDAMSLVKVSGDWLAAPGLRVGLSAYTSDDGAASSPAWLDPWAMDGASELLFANALDAVEGLDFNVSFGIQTERVGDFLVGLQLARYRQRAGLAELALASAGLSSTALTEAAQYGNSAQLLLGWRRGRFSGEMLGQHRELPPWISSYTAAPTFSSFDLELSWKTQRNASLSIGVSNVMDTLPRAADERGSDAVLEDPMESIYGRIPYVRYKQDL